MSNNTSQFNKPSKIDQKISDLLKDQGTKNDEWVLVRVTYEPGQLEKYKKEYGVKSLTDYITFRYQEPQQWELLPFVKAKLSGGPFHTIQHDETGQTAAFRLAFLREGEFNIQNYALVGSINYIDKGENVVKIMAEKYPGINFGNASSKEKNTPGITFKTPKPRGF